MTINERLKAIREAMSKPMPMTHGGISLEAFQQCMMEIANHLTAIQASIESAETDAGKLASEIIKEFDWDDGVIYYDKSKVTAIIQFALLAQREKYDALITKADVDASNIAEKVFSEAHDFSKAKATITAALLKAGQREHKCEWKTQGDDNYETSCNNGFVIIHGTPEENDMAWCPYCAGKIVSPPSSQEGVG